MITSIFFITRHMNILKYSLFVLSLLFSYSAPAQKSDQILMRINDTPVTKSEFEYAYKKSQGNAGKQNQTIEDFLQSYINLKLVVEEAKTRKLDKTKGFINEYSGYIEQLQEPYLTDSISPVIVAKDIYERLKENIEFCQLFLKLPKGNILPKDTINIYKKILSIRNLATNGDFENFGSLVKEYSEDSLSKNSRIPGYMGWRTAFSTPKVFEDIMYSTDVNSVSQPIRIGDGYRLLWILNKKPDSGQVNIAHILFLYPNMEPTPHQKDSVQRIALEVLDELRNGGNFAELCRKYSSDLRSAQSGGNLGWFGVYNPPPPDFANVLSKLENVGEITPLIETEYGLHIFKLADQVPMQTWEEMKNEIIEKIPQTERRQVLTGEKIKRLAKDYPYILDKEGYKKLELAADLYYPTDSAFYDVLKPDYNILLLEVGSKKFYIHDFLSYLRTNSRSDYTLSTDVLQYKVCDFILHTQTEMKRNDLPEKHPDLDYLMKEFHDGLLYFDIMSTQIWDKAQSDKDALKRIFEKNRDKYKWDSPRFKGYVIHAKNKQIMSEVKAAVDKNKGASNIQVLLQSTLDSASMKNIIIDKGLWAKGDNAFVDKKLYNIKSDKEIIGYPEHIIEGKLISSPKEPDDVLGLVVTDYQEILEQEWLKELHKKYNVEINEDIFNSIK